MVAYSYDLYRHTQPGVLLVCTKNMKRTLEVNNWSTRSMSYCPKFLANKQNQRNNCFSNGFKMMNTKNELYNNMCLHILLCFLAYIKHKKFIQALNLKHFRTRKRVQFFSCIYIQNRISKLARSYIQCNILTKYCDLSQLSSLNFSFRIIFVVGN